MRKVFDICGKFSDSSGKFRYGYRCGGPAPSGCQRRAWGSDLLAFREGPAWASRFQELRSAQRPCPYTDPRVAAQNPGPSWTEPSPGRRGPAPAPRGHALCENEMFRQHAPCLPSPPWLNAPGAHSALSSASAASGPREKERRRRLNRRVESYPEPPGSEGVWGTRGSRM